RETGNGKRARRRHVSRFSFSVSPLFVPQCFYGIKPRRLIRRIQSESDAGEGGGGQRRENGPERYVRRNRRHLSDGERDQTAEEHPDGAPHEREGRGLDEELPLDRAPRRAERDRKSTRLNS